MATVDVGTLVCGRWVVCGVVAIPGALGWGGGGVLVVALVWCGSAADA